MKIAISFILKGYGNKKELFTRIVAVKLIIGYRENCNGSVHNVDSVPLCEVEQ